MIAWLFLLGAIVFEVVGTMSLRASIDSSGWAVLAVAAYVSTFVLLGLALRAGMAIGAAYAIWGALGVTLTAALGVVLFAEQLSPAAIGGIGLIIVGVVLVETGSHRVAAS